MKSFYRMLVFVFALISLVSQAQAEEAAPEAPAETAAPAMSAADQEAMEKAKKMMAPGEAHKALEPFVGKWNYTAKFWMKPDAEPQQMTGTSENSMVYGGRFLKQLVTGTWMNEPFEGLGYTGYDNVKQEYQSVWIDGMATGIMSSAGQYDAATKTLSQSGTASCPMTGEKDMKMRSEAKVVDADRHTYTSYATGADGKEFKGMEIEYTRAQ